MSRWVRGIYNAAANFNMSRSLRAAAGRILDRDTEHVREECDKPNKCEQPCKSSKPSCAAASTTTATASSTRASASSSGTSTCATSSERGNSCFPSGNNNIANNVYAKSNNKSEHNDSCTCALCIDYRDYTASIRTEGQGAGSWIRLSDESGTFKQSNPDATGSVERVTGIPTGVTI